MNHSRNLATLILLATAVAAGCSSSSSDTGATGTSGGTTGGTSGGTPGTTGGTPSGSSTGAGTSGGSSATTGGGPVDAGSGPIILAQRIFTPDGRLYYVSVLSQMPTAPIDLATATEFTSADVEIFMGKVFIRDRVANTMTRYSVGAGNALVQDAQFSFQSAGLPSGRIYNVYLSPTLAYALDGTNLQMVGWDPTNMALLPGNVVDISFLTGISPLPDISSGSRRRWATRSSSR